MPCRAGVCLHVTPGRMHGGDIPVTCRVPVACKGSLVKYAWESWTWGGCLACGATISRDPAMACCCEGSSGGREGSRARVLVHVRVRAHRCERQTQAFLAGKRLRCPGLFKLGLRSAIANTTPPPAPFHWCTSQHLSLTPEIAGDLAARHEGESGPSLPQEQMPPGCEVRAPIMDRACLD